MTALAAIGALGCGKAHGAVGGADGGGDAGGASCEATQVDLACGAPCAVRGAVEIACFDVDGRPAIAAGPPGIAYLAQVQDDVTGSPGSGELVVVDARGSGRVYPTPLGIVFAVASDAQDECVVFGQVSVTNGPLQELTTATLQNGAFATEDVGVTGFVDAAGIGPGGAIVVAYHAPLPSGNGPPALARRSPGGAWSLLPLTQTGRPQRVFFDGTGGARILAGDDCASDTAGYCGVPADVTEEIVGGASRVLASLNGFDDATYAASAARYLFSHAFAISVDSAGNLLSQLTITSVGVAGAPDVVTQTTAAFPSSNTCEDSLPPGAPCSGTCTRKFSEIGSSALAVGSDGAAWLAYARIDVDRDFNYVYRPPAGENDPGGCGAEVTADRTTSSLVVARVATDGPPTLGATWTQALGTGEWRVARRPATRGTDLLLWIQPAPSSPGVPAVRARVLAIDTTALPH